MAKKYIEELGDIVTGKTPKTKIEDNFGNEFLFITPDDLTNGFPIKTTRRYLSNKGLDEVSSNSINGISVIVDCIGSDLGNVAMTNNKCVTNQQINAITNFKSNVNPYYIYFWFKNKKKYLQRIAGGTSVPIVNKGQFSKIEIELPNKETQDRIANKLLIFENKIEFNRKLSYSIEEYSQLLFHKWFVDFNFPDKEGKPYKDNGGKMYEVDGKMIPEGWERIKLSKLVCIKSDTVNPQDNSNKFFKHYSIPVFDDTSLYSEELGETIKSNKYLVMDNSILVSKLNPWFNRVVYPYKVDEAICSTEFVVLEPFIDCILETLYVIVSSNNFISYCTNAATGTSNSHKRVKPEYMMSYEVNFDKEVVKKFNDFIKTFVIKKHQMLLESKLLKETRDLLIKKLIK